MMTHQLEVSILSAPLAAIDRRALSQAWYNALHTTQISAARPCGERVADVPLSPSCVVLQKQGGRRLTSAARPALAATPSKETRDLVKANDVSVTRRPAQPLGRRIELHFSSSTAPTARATFTLGRGKARVHVIMQSNGSTARLVAICRPHMSEIVARALAEARLALSARRIRTTVIARTTR